MASIQTLERRILALESRLAEVEGGFGETIYKLERRTVRLDLNVTKVLNHLSVTPATEDEVNAVLDQE